VAAVALARKVLCILYHLLMNREMYQENEVTKIKSIDIEPSSLPTKMGFEEMIRVLVKAGYEIRNTSSTGG
jgi:transposase